MIRFRHVKYFLFCSLQKILDLVGTFGNFTFHSSRVYLQGIKLCSRKFVKLLVMMLMVIMMVMIIMMVMLIVITIKVMNVE